ncbi:hypothetical protein AMR41_26250, partial [Hapalosiphon sp. MRB220]
MAEELKTKRKTSDRTKKKGGLTGSSQFTENGSGDRAKAIAEAAGTVLNNVSGAAQTVSNVAGKLTNTTAQVAKAGGDAVQAIRGLAGQPGYGYRWRI